MTSVCTGRGSCVGDLFESHLESDVTAETALLVFAERELAKGLVRENLFQDCTTGMGSLDRA
jgi:hypothetical protein